MSNAHHPQPAGSDPVQPFLNIAGRRIIESLYTHNPLYVLSVCFVLHGTSLLLPKTVNPNMAATSCN